jgi:hypothetical protein
MKTPKLIASMQPNLSMTGIKMTMNGSNKKSAT